MLAPDTEFTARFQRWPRLYLDTAEFVSIGRAHVDAALIERLVAATAERRIVLVVSSEHLRELLNPGDDAARERTVETITRFPFRGLVTSGPYDVEPWESDVAVDITVSPWGNVREVIEAREADPSLRQMDAAQDTVAAAEQAAVEVQRALPTQARQRASHAHVAIVHGSIRLLLLGHQGDDIGDQVDWCASALGRTLAANERAMLIERVRPAVAMLQSMAPLLDSASFDDRVTIARRMALGPEKAPGSWLAMALSGARRRDVNRTVLRSDSVDLAHATHFPYVDIATADGNVVDLVGRFLRDVHGTRDVAVFRNNRMGDLVQHLERLPVAE